MDDRSGAIEAAIAGHDREVAERGLVLWLGGEPTFTDRQSTAAEWTTAALGDDKRRRAESLAARLLRPGGVLLRTLGRQYPDEEVPRWSFGLYEWRDGTAMWNGPRDPMQRAPADVPPTEESMLEAAARLRDGLALALGGRSFDVPDADLPLRVVVGAADPDAADGGAALRRGRLDLQKIAEDGPLDALARDGSQLFCIGCDSVGVDDRAVVLELPGVAEVDAFSALLGTVARVAAESGCRELVLGGYGPPVDSRVSWTTVTPDPAVVEVNMAPCASVAEYAAESRRIHEAAGELGLSSHRLYFNGDEADSGGGGHLTFGGASPEHSPFFAFPMLVPRMVAYFNRHPSLSYLFAVDSLGSSSQSPRADESTRESFGELGVALDLLAKDPQPGPERIWEALAPFLTDRFGNTHRCEINVEKLWNPYFPSRGKLGVVELRAFRMALDWQRASAVAALMRAIVARLAATEVSMELVDWGGRLHDEFSLPSFLRRDLGLVLDDLRRDGLGLDDVLIAELERATDRTIARLTLADDCTLTVERALEFWPLVGDLSQQNNTSRLVDPSCARLEVRLSGLGAPDWALFAGEYRLPVHNLEVDGERLRLLGLRYRAFRPGIGLHPSLPDQSPISFCASGPRGEVKRVSVHSWHPLGGAYEGLPENRAEAAQRRAERVVVEDAEEPPDLHPVPGRARSAFCVDLRRIL